MKSRKNDGRQFEFPMTAAWIERQRLDEWLKAHAARCWCSPVCSVVGEGGGR